MLIASWRMGYDLSSENNWGQTTFYFLDLTGKRGLSPINENVFNFDESQPSHNSISTLRTRLSRASPATIRMTNYSFDLTHRSRAI